jgi:phosphoglycerate dehydrogenase-like enzyme
VARPEVGEKVDTPRRLLVSNPHHPLLARPAPYMLPDMPNKPLSRRSFMATTGAVPAVAATRHAVVVPNVLLSDTKATQDVLRIVTLYKFEPAEVQKIQAASPKARVELAICASREELNEKVKDAEVVYGDIRADTLQAAKKLQWVQSGEAGMENMDPALRASPVVLTNYQRVFAPGISETAMGLLLCLTRGLAKYYMPQFYKQRTMQHVGTAKSAHHTELVGRTMGIVGMGGVGTAVARRAHYGFDMRVVATDAKPVPKPDFVAELHDPGWFMEMVPQVDVLVAAAPLTPITERMFNEKVFRSMKKSAHFLALSRGKLYDDMALVRALKENWIAGAGLDVFPIEPPPSDHPIFDCPNVVMSAHTSGWSPDRQVRLIDLFAENVRRYTEGLPLLNVVDKKAGY